MADRYAIINIPTVIWIDEAGMIVRPNDIQFSNDTFIDFHGIESAPHLQALREWVCEGKVPYDCPEAIRDAQMLPTVDEQLARAEFALACHLHHSGAGEAAAPHFERAGELAPYDFTIRRAAMPIRGQDPFGEPFIELFTEWQEAGSANYANRSVKAQRSQD